MTLEQALGHLQPVLAAVPVEHHGTAIPSAIADLPRSARPGERNGYSPYYCPCCLQSVRPDAARPRLHHEACGSGPIDAVLLHCPSCELVLAAEVDVALWRDGPAW